MGSFMMGMDQDKKEEGKLAKTTRDRYIKYILILRQDSRLTFSCFSDCWLLRAVSLCLLSLLHSPVILSFLF